VISPPHPGRRPTAAPGPVWGATARWWGFLLDALTFVLGTFPAAVDGQLRALFVVAGNPVLSVPNSKALETALPQLDLFVSLDLYVNENNRLADYILPGTTMLKRDNLPIMFAACSPTLFVLLDRGRARTLRAGPPGVAGVRRTRAPDADLAVRDRPPRAVQPGAGPPGPLPGDPDDAASDDGAAVAVRALR
jgi:Molybdopterin oxidoreductase